MKVGTGEDEPGVVGAVPEPGEGGACDVGTEQARVVEALQVGQLGVEGKLVLGLPARRRRVAELDADVVATREKGDVLVPACGEESASPGGDPEDLEEQPAVQSKLRAMLSL